MVQQLANLTLMTARAKWAIAMALAAVLVCAAVLLRMRWFDWRLVLSIGLLMMIVNVRLVSRQQNREIIDKLDRVIRFRQRSGPF
jgi:hypothetical protein